MYIREKRLGKDPLTHRNHGGILFISLFVHLFELKVNWRRLKRQDTDDVRIEHKSPTGAETATVSTKLLSLSSWAHS